MYDKSLLLAGTPRADMRRAGLECGLRWSQPPGARTVCCRAEYGRRSEAGGDGALATGDGVPDSGRVDSGRGLRGRGVVLP